MLGSKSFDTLIVTGSVTSRQSVKRKITPLWKPGRRRLAEDAGKHVTNQPSPAREPRAIVNNELKGQKVTDGVEIGGRDVRYLPSPVRLTKIRDLAPHQNVDAVGLGDVLGDPLIEECWCFDYLFDVPFIM